MNIQRFHAPTSREALAKARMAFGEGTLILSNRPTASGVEVVATAEDSLAALDQSHAAAGKAALCAAKAPGHHFRPGLPDPGGRRRRTAGHEHALVPGLCARKNAAAPTRQPARENAAASRSVQSAAE